MIMRFALALASTCIAALPAAAQTATTPSTRAEPAITAENCIPQPACRTLYSGMNPGEGIGTNQRGGGPPRTRQPERGPRQPVTPQR
jgi:hypothetical protein